MYKKQILSNGVRLLTMPMPGAKTFSILVMIKTGSRHETKTIRGLSHFVEHMMFKGTKKRPNTLAISSALDSIGGEFNAFTAQEYTGYYAKVDGTQADKAVDVISDIILYSKFDAAEIERERGVILAEIQMYESNPMIHIDDLFERCLYGDTPAGWDTIGTKSAIKNFQRQDFLQYVESQYRGSAVVVGLAGAFERIGRPEGAYAIGYGTILIRRGERLHGHVASVSVLDDRLYMSTETYRCGSDATPKKLSTTR